MVSEKFKIHNHFTLFYSTMKRAAWLMEDPRGAASSFCYPKIYQLLHSSTKKLHRFTIRVPTTMEPHQSKKIDLSICETIYSILDRNESMIIEDELSIGRLSLRNPGGIKFLFFLGAQGKEYIDDIVRLFPDQFDSILFISSNLEVRQDPTLNMSDSEECRQLSTYFQVKDPLGGANYPLNYLVVIDEENIIRCKLPIKIGRYCLLHDKFGANLEQLEGLIEEYLTYFASVSSGPKGAIKIF